MKKRFRGIITAFSVSFIIMAGLSLFSLNRFSALVNYSYWVDHTNNVINQIYKVQSVIRDIDRFERGYMLTKDTMYIRVLNNAIAKITPYTDTLKYLTKDNEKEQNNIVILKSDFAIRLAYIRQNISFVDTTIVSTPSSYYYDGRKAMLNCMNEANAMLNEERSLMVTRNQSRISYEQITSASLRYILTSFCIVTILLFVFIVRELKKRVAYQEELQSKVIDLQRSHAELEQIAHAASHDLQEPLRKIQVFTDRFLWMQKDKLDGEGRKTIERITAAALRMQELIEDLVGLTSLTRPAELQQITDLNAIVIHVKNELAQKINEQNAAISTNTLPEISGYPDQLLILFRALLDNALKFSRPGIEPLISVNSEECIADAALEKINPGTKNKKFHVVTITDNGIGFDNKFSEKMFQIFQRLHTQQSEYTGKGIGLAICQRIMANHEGYILGYGNIGIGATFKLYFPINN
ncbi:MAG: CHASE3 domain-containing protein [Taibaiella sp.]|nr:CHASE3 domain-containing protein [Taibaiella sp.]